MLAQRPGFKVSESQGQCLNVSGSVDIALKSSEPQEFDLDRADGVDQAAYIGHRQYFVPRSQRPSVAARQVDRPDGGFECNRD